MAYHPSHEELEQRIQELEQKLSDHKQLTKELQESEERFKALHDASFAGVVIHDKGKILDCNQGLSDITGFTNEELVGMDGLSLIAPDSLELVLHNIKSGHDERYEVEGVRKDGSLYPLAIKGKNIPYKGDQVRVIEFRDITEIKEAGEALRKSEIRHSTMVANIGDVIVIIDEDGTVRYNSPNIERWFGWTQEDVIGRGVFEFIHPDDLESVRDMFANILRETGKTIAHECKYLCKDGTVKWIEFNGINLRHNPDIRGILVNYRDISKRREVTDEKARLELRLLQAQKMEAIGTLAGGIAHDFNNILSVILGYADLAMEDAPEGSDFANDVEQILVAANRAKNLVKQILDFGRQTQSVRIPIKIQPLVEEGFKMLRSSLPSTISMTKKIDKNCETILADPTQVHQILMNLCTNAFHSMEATGGELSVTLKTAVVEPDNEKLALLLQPGQYVELSVSDTGAGISPVVLEKIFDPYFTTKDVGKGTGMGLAIIHGIMKHYGGTITVESQVDKGSTFHVYFPVAGEKALAAAEKQQNIPLGTERILFIDDEESLNDLGKEMLGRLGYHVTGRCSSLEGLATFQQEPDAFDLVITDQTMPDLTGTEVAKRILQIRPNMPIILCTGYSNLVDENSAKLMGIKEFATKPLTKRALGELVRKVLDAPGAFH